MSHLGLDPTSTVEATRPSLSLPLSSSTVSAIWRRSCPLKLVLPSMAGPGGYGAAQAEDAINRYTTGETLRYEGDFQTRQFTRSGVSGQWGGSCAYCSKHSCRLGLVMIFF